MEWILVTHDATFISEKWPNILTAMLFGAMGVGGVLVALDSPIAVVVVFVGLPSALLILLSLRLPFLGVRVTETHVSVRQLVRTVEIEVDDCVDARLVTKRGSEVAMLYRLSGNPVRLMGLDRGIVREFRASATSPADKIMEINSAIGRARSRRGRR